MVNGKWYGVSRVESKQIVCVCVFEKKGTEAYQETAAARDAEAMIVTSQQDLEATQADRCILQQQAAMRVTHMIRVGHYHSISWYPIIYF
ncbi:unnamed protein product [Urochloa humidicola]